MSSRPRSEPVTTSSLMSSSGSPTSYLRSAPEPDTVTGLTTPSRSATYRASAPGRVTSAVGASASAAGVSVSSISSRGDSASAPAEVVSVDSDDALPDVDSGSDVVPAAPVPPSSSAHAATVSPSANTKPTARLTGRTLRGDRPADRSPGRADQTLLHHRGHERALTGEHEPAGQAAPVGGVGAVLLVEQPVVGPEGAVEPHRVIEARHEEAGIEPTTALGPPRGVEQRHVRRVGEHDRVDERVVGEAAVGPQPHPLPGRQGALAVWGQPVDVADVDGPGPVDPRPDVPLVIPDPLAQGGQLLGRGDVGHLERVLE